MAPTYPDLTTFKALSFDCYGTLIDWQAGFLKSISTVTSQLPKDHPLNTEPPWEAMMRLHEISVGHEEATPNMPYNEILVTSLSQFAKELNIPLPDSISEPFGNSPGTWVPFPDTVPGLQKLMKHYKLIILSNIDNANISATVSKQLAPAEFAAVFTAQNIGSYKPSKNNFDYLFSHAKSELGIDWQKGDLLHVARSLRADHVPAKTLGLRSVWISRGGEVKGQGGTGGDYEALKDKTAFEWRFDTIGDFADEVERQFAAKEGK
ncbi:HAD-like domain-containing protein [Xylariaceae sp. FL0255]|nr:HAD-like domain-containing protein [Xylariaceae sp. FL0255]